MSAFVSLIFGFCAAISDHGHSVLLGYKAKDECVVVTELGAEDERPNIVADGHTINWAIFDEGALIKIDDQTFTVLKFGGA